jgi:single-strand DNA-binding protein
VFQKIQISDSLNKIGFYLAGIGSEGPYKSPQRRKTMNKVILVGNLGADPEMKATASGTNVTNLRLATNRKWTSKDGEKMERTDWHRVTLWGRQAEVAAQYLSKGRQVLIEGRLEYTKVGEGDEAKYYTDVVAERLELLGGKGGNGSTHEQEGDETPF